MAMLDPSTNSRGDLPTPLPCGLHAFADGLWMSSTLGGQGNFDLVHMNAWFGIWITIIQAALALVLVNANMWENLRHWTRFPSRWTSYQNTVGPGLKLPLVGVILTIAGKFNYFSPGAMDFLEFNDTTCTTAGGSFTASIKHSSHIHSVVVPVFSKQCGPPLMKANLWISFPMSWHWPKSKLDLSSFSWCIKPTRDIVPENMAFNSQPQRMG